MEIIFVKDYDEMSLKTFEIIKETVQSKPQSTLSMTTGGTPQGLFEILVKKINEKEIDISQTTFLNLDEYIGPKNAPYSVYRYMHENFYDLINFKPKEIHLINGDSNNVDKEIIRYSEILRRNPRDIQILGLGTNGHIGANEPGTPFDSEIFLANHDDSTIKSTIKQYDLTESEAPTQMITLGFKEIIEATKVILMVSGTSKAKAVKDLVEGPISVKCPASFLQDKDNVILIVDQEASSLLSK